MSNIAAIISSVKPNCEEIEKNFFVHKEANLDFDKIVKAAFECIAKNAIGKRLLEKIAFLGSKIFIIYGEEDAVNLQDEMYSQNSLAIITFSMKEFTCRSVEGTKIPFPTHVVLFHELVHAYHNLSGKQANSVITDSLVWSTDEEYKTIMGFPSKKGNRTKAKITENAFRREEGLPERFGHRIPLASFGHVVFLDTMHRLCFARTKILSKIHEKNLQRLPQSFAPPPIAQCSISDLGEKNYCVLYAQIRGVNFDYSANPKAIADFFWIPPSEWLDQKLGTKCYLRLASDISREDMVACFPKLGNTQFEVKSLTLMRVSEEEMNIIEREGYE